VLQALRVLVPTFHATPDAPAAVRAKPLTRPLSAAKPLGDLALVPGVYEVAG
jgi:hypothetical protein